MADIQMEPEEEPTEMENEVVDFANEIEELIETARQIPGQSVNFNPMLFYLWKLSKKKEKKK
jgi:hypothetical protein